MSNKILHIMVLDKFLAPFIDFVDEHFGREDHHYVFITSEKYNYGLTPEHQVEFLYTDEDIFITLLSYMQKARKIILHGLWRDKVDLLLLQNPELFEKCYWVMWGGDFYFPEKHSKNRHKIIERIGGLVTYLGGDIDYVRQHYNARGKYHECTMYPSNLYKEYEVPTKKVSAINIQVGNSADPTNNHLEALEKLLPFKNQDIAIYVPLSYGNREHAQKIINQGREWFGDKFKPLTEFMPFEDYLKLLGTIDIAMFNHKRQQAMGNTITLLGLGKTVYMRSDTTQWQFFKEKNIVVGDIKNMKALEPLDVNGNQEKIKCYFSKENFINQLKDIFNGVID